MGATFEALAPTVAGEYHIFITAHAAGYRDVTKNYPITVVECVPMLGDLKIAAQAEMIKKETVQFNAIGITSPVNVTYKWYASSFSPASFTGGAIWNPQAPKDDGIYTIAVVATAENYCTISFDTTILVKPGRKMQGLFDFTPSLPIIKGQKVTFTAHGITTPSAEYIEYKWLAPGFTEGTTTGNSYTATCPKIAGAYTVTVTAKAIGIGYSDSTVSRLITVGDELPMQGGGTLLSIDAPPEVIVSQPVTFHVTSNITDPPKEDISFVWNAPNFNPLTHESTSLTFSTTAPATEGDYTISVTARAAKYSGVFAYKTVTVKGGKDMDGTLDFHVPSQVVKDLEATFIVDSDLSPKTPITYEWEAPGFSATTFGGATFTGIPTSAGLHTITLRAKANGYATRSKNKTVTVIDGLDMGELTISDQGGNPEHSFNAGIDDVTFTPALSGLPPISTVTYTWEAPGCKPAAHTGNQFKPFLPPKEGNYTITLTASATGYHPKTATFGYKINCNQMTVDFIPTRTELLTGDVTTLTAHSSVATGTNYTWIIPSNFTIESGTSITSSVTIKAPSAPLPDPVNLTLTAEATNYCGDSHTATVTVQECYNLPKLPVITADLGEDNGTVTVPSRRPVTFSTPVVKPWKVGGTTTYNWNFTPSAYPFDPSGTATNSNSFTTVAPGFNAENYTLELRVKSDGYCDHEPVSKKVVIGNYTGTLAGEIRIQEAEIDNANPSGERVVWIAKSHLITLTAYYIPTAQEDNIDITYDWQVMDNNGQLTPITSAYSASGILEFTPQSDVNNRVIIVKVTDKNGRAPINKAFPYTVQDCAYLGSDLYINVNNKCGTTVVNNPTVRIKDAKDGTIYRAVNIRNRWWFAENLKRVTANSMQHSTLTELGRYYERNSSTQDDMHDPTKGAPCPVGWKIPGASDWSDLASIDGANFNQFKLLANGTAAIDPTSANATTWVRYQNYPYSNEYDFSALPGGYLVGGSPSLQGRAAYFMTYGADVWYLGNTSGASPSTINGALGSATASDGEYYNIRCVRDFP
jgi:uncharacterized protein (TIGR02145 family)